VAEEALAGSAVTEFEAGADERMYAASQWQLMWWRLRQHRLAMGAGVVLMLFYLVALGAEFLATSDPQESSARRGLMPPQPIHFFEGWRFSPHVYAIQGKRDLRHDAQLDGFMD